MQKNYWIVRYCIVCIVFIYFYSTPLNMSHSERSWLQHWYRVGVNTPKRYRQLRVNYLPKVLTWQLEWDLNLRPSGRKAPNPTTESPRPTMMIIRYEVIQLQNISEINFSGSVQRTHLHRNHISLLKSDLSPVLLLFHIPLISFNPSLLKIWRMFHYIHTIQYNTAAFDIAPSKLRSAQDHMTEHCLRVKDSLKVSIQ